MVLFASSTQKLKVVHGEEVVFWPILLPHRIPLSGTGHQQWFLEPMAWVNQNILPLVRHLVRSILEQCGSAGPVSGKRLSDLVPIKPKKGQNLMVLVDLFVFS